MNWANLLHIYQPPRWEAKVIKRVVNESYRPVINILKRNKQVKITLNINGSLSEQLSRLGYLDVIEGIRFCAERGQIEFTGSAKYHGILPLLPIEEVRRQIRLNNEVNRIIFGDIYHPRGFFPPEMSVNLDLVGVLVELGFEWVALDEIAAESVLGKGDLSKRYRIKPFSFTAILRNRSISDYFSFKLPTDRPSGFFREVKHEARSEPVLITAFDGENLGHHRIGTDRIWEQLVTDPEVVTCTYSEAVEKFSKEVDFDIQPCSWSTRTEDIKQGAPYPLWQHPDNPIHQLQWSLTKLVIDAVNQAEKKSDRSFKKARALLDEALASDQYWWASATPWWSMDIVIQGAERLGFVIKTLQAVSGTTVDEAHQLIQSIIKTTRLWQKEGTAKARNKQFLKETKSVKYFGGQRIDSLAN
ncbi:MAG: hypothetical protein V1853_03815 [bacterium]